MLCAAAQTQDWANFGRFEQANDEVRNPKVVLMGNSITDGWDNAHPEFFTANNFACRGIGGQVTGQMLCRFRADVINLHPQAVVILAGTNDLAQNNGPIATQHIVENIAWGELSREVIVPLLPLNGWFSDAGPHAQAAPAAAAPDTAGHAPVPQPRGLGHARLHHGVAAGLDLDAGLGHELRRAPAQRE